MPKWVSISKFSKYAKCTQDYLQQHLETDIEFVLLFTLNWLLFSFSWENTKNRRSFIKNAVEKFGKSKELIIQTILEL